jgi:uncharacterized RDD family membrane protein YckC
LNSPIDTIVTAETPEGISISIRPAGFAVRATAFLIDAFIRIALLSALSPALAIGRRVGFGIYLISAFVINWLYPVLFELSAAAATPGKRIMGLYVLMANGLPVTPAACLVRNLLRLVDMLPFLYAFGIVCVLLRADSRRLGDLAAGTIVAYRQELELTGKLAEGTPTPPPIPLSRRQQLALTAFAWRVDRLTPARGEEIAAYAVAAAPALLAPGDGARHGSTSRLVGIARWLQGDRPAASSAGPARAGPAGAPRGLVQ